MKTNEMHDYKIRVCDLRDALPAEVVEAQIQWNRDEICELAWALPKHCDLSEFVKVTFYGRKRLPFDLLWDALVRAHSYYNHNGTDEPTRKVTFYGRKFGTGMHHRTQTSRVDVRVDGLVVYIKTCHGTKEIYMDNFTGEQIIETSTI